MSFVHISIFMSVSWSIQGVSRCYLTVCTPQQNLKMYTEKWCIDFTMLLCDEPKWLKQKSSVFYTPGFSSFYFFIFKAWNLVIWSCKCVITTCSFLIIISLCKRNYCDMEIFLWSQATDAGYWPYFIWFPRISCCCFNVNPTI